MAGEARALGREAVDVRRRRVRASVDAEVTEAQIVRDDEEDVGTSGGCDKWDAENGSEEKDTYAHQSHTEIMA